MSVHENKFGLYRDREGVVRDCFSCQIISGEKRKPENHIYATAAFDAHQDYEIPIPGMIIIASKEHKRYLDEFTPTQQHEYIDLVSRIGQTIKDALGVSFLYYFRRDDTKHHFHTWVFPRYAWMEPFGTGIGSIQPIIDAAYANRNTPQGLQEINSATQRLRAYFL